MSTEHQRYSPDNQAAAIAVYAQEHGFKIVRTYIDAGKSGLSLQGRAGLKALFGDILSGKADYATVLVLDLGRWGRFQDPDQSAHYEFLCRQAGVEVHYCAEKFDNDFSLSSSLLKHVKRVMAGEYVRELSDKVTRGKRHLASLGYKQGSVTGFGLARLMVGHDRAPKGILAPGQRKALDDDRVMIARGAPEEVAAIRTIFRLFCVERLSTTSIADCLTERRAPLYDGKPWSNRQVRCVLKNPIYSGTYQYGRTRSYLRNRLGPAAPDTWICVEVIAPIVSKKRFSEAQRLRGSRYAQSFSDAELCDGLRRVLREHGTISAALIDKARYLPSVRAYYDRFGSLTTAYARIGWEQPNSPRQPVSRRFTDAQMLAELAGILERYGFISNRTILDTPSCPTREALIARFGSLETAYARVGYETSASQQRRLSARLARSGFYRLHLSHPEEAKTFIRRQTYLSNTELLERLKTVFARHGKLTYALIDADPDCPTAEVYRYRFGTVHAAQLAAGLPTVRLSDRVILEQLRAVHRKHGKLNTEIIHRDPDCPSLGTYTHRFGSLGQAYAAAGIAQKTRKSRSPRAQAFAKHAG